MMSSCPACGRCPFSGGVCEDRVNRGRRFFLLGALAAPLVRPLARVAAIVEPTYAVPHVLFDPTLIRAIQDRTLVRVYRDALFPRLLFRMEQDAVLSLPAS